MYLLKMVDNARSARKQESSGVKPVDDAMSAEKDDRSVESLVDFIEEGESLALGGATKKKRKRKKKMQRAEEGNADMRGVNVVEEDQATVEPLSDVKEDLDPTAVSSLEKTKLKKSKKMNKHHDRESLKYKEKFLGTNEVASRSAEIVGAEDNEVEEELLTPVDKLEALSKLNEDHDDPLTQELAAKESELHELLESEVNLVESKGKEMSALLLAVDELDDEKHDVDKKVAEINAQITELQISKDQLEKYKEEKDRKLEKLLKKKTRLENFIEEKVREQKETERRLEKEIEEIKVRFKETQRDNKNEAHPEGLNLLVEWVEYVNGQIESKEEELECPVCLEVVSPPLFCCDDQHLICAECRPKVDGLLV